MESEATAEGEEEGDVEEGEEEKAVFDKIFIGFSMCCEFDETRDIGSKQRKQTTIQSLLVSHFTVTTTTTTMKTRNK